MSFVKLVPSKNHSSGNNDVVYLLRQQTLIFPMLKDLIVFYFTTF